MWTNELRLERLLVDARETIAQYRAGLTAVLDTLSDDDVSGFIAYLHTAYEQGKQVFIIGNGGSAATASHLACDLAKTVLGKVGALEARRYRVIALTDNVPLITAWSNDLSYETVFAEQLRNLANQGDLLISITGSGNSPNIIAAVKAARELGLKCVGLLGFDGGLIKGMLDHSVLVESDNYGYIEDAHMILCHLATAHFIKALAQPLRVENMLEIGGERRHYPLVSGVQSVEKSSLAEAGRQAFKPIRILQVELSQPLSAVPAFSDSGQRYERAIALVRLHTQPLGLVELQLGDQGLSAAENARQIWNTLQQEIVQHLEQDALSQVTDLAPSGLPSSRMPKCQAERQRILAAPPFVSVVIATRDRPETLNACLQSLVSLDYPQYEIVVVDNAPRTQATVNLFGRAYAQLSQVRYVREDRPGLAWARNRGIAEARGDVIAFTDDDVVVDRHWLAGLAEGFAAADDVACVTGLILPLEIETQAQAWFEQFGGFSKGFTRRIFDTAAHHPNDPLFPYAAGRFGSGNNMAFRSSVLRALGGFDPALGAGALVGGEDLDAFFRLITNGYVLVYQPSAIVHHLHRRDYATLCKQLSDGSVGGYLTKAVIEQPQLLLDIARKLPRGLVYALSPRSPKNAHKRPDYPKELTRVERWGLLRAPVAYMRSRRRVRELNQLLGPLDIHPSRAPMNNEHA
jgi:phosphoheptose isomerase/GT2 family glycosyltransferase